MSNQRTISYAEMAKENPHLLQAIQTTTGDRVADGAYRLVYDICVRSDRVIEEKLVNGIPEETAIDGISKAYIAPLIHSLSKTAMKNPNARGAFTLLASISKRISRIKKGNSFLDTLKEFSLRSKTMNELLTKLHDANYHIANISCIIGHPYNSNFIKALSQFARENGIEVPYKVR